MSSELLQEHTLYKSLFENAYSVMLILDPATGEILDANSAAISFYQYSKNSLLGMNISQINMPVAPKKDPGNKPSGLKKNYINVQQQLKNGDIKDVEIYNSPILYKEKEMVCAIIHDISHRKQAEETLRKSESTIRAMINAINNLVYLFDMSGRILDLNKQGANLFKKTPEEMIGKKFKPFFNDNDYNQLRYMVQKVQETNESLNYQKVQNNRHFDVSFYPVLNKKEQVYRICVFAKDITDLKKTEKVFAAIETAGAICHEMNQPLQVILGNLELLKLNINEEDANHKFVNILMEQTERLGKITRKLTHITRYETKEYIKGTIFDIDKSSNVK